ncbi:MAG: hypothetical protein RIC55_07855 [Pirellulaceae bacterium]
MSDGQGVVRAVSWRDMCPWLIIFRSFGLALRGGMLLAATAAVLLTPLGWKLADVAFISAESREANPGFARSAERLGSWPSGGAATARSADDVLEHLGRTRSLAAEAFHQITSPFRSLFSTGLTTQQTAFYIFGALWTLAIWAFFGGLITRMAAVELGREERITLKEAVLFTGRKYVSYLVAPLAPLCVVLLILLLSIPVGWLMAADATLPFAGLLWILVLLGGFVSAVVLLGLLLGWPLMWATVSSEGTDAFDALSRGYAYTFQRPLHYLFYAVLVLLFGALASLLVSLFADSVVGLAYWATGWGAGNERIGVVQAYVAGGGEPSGMQWMGVSLIGALNSLVYCFATGFAFSFFWCAATAVYLLLRYDVDQTEFDEIHMDDEDVSYALPPLMRDEAGVPTAPSADQGAEAAAASGEGDGDGDGSHAAT